MHHHVHHPLIRKQIMLTYQCVITLSYSGMVRSELIKRNNLFNKINVRRANQQGELRS